jgi:glycosyltransferase involved in cell wall biosynthesis
MGGINLYLQHKMPALSRLPRWMSRLLDAPGLLRWSAGHSDMTSASELGAMTVSMLRGEQGRAAAELDRLIEWIGTQPLPDVICLSNVLLAGMVRRLKDALGAPVVCTLQGEAPFLDSLPPPHAQAAWDELAARAADIDGFAAVSGYYGALMARRLRVPAHKLRVIHNGIELDGLGPAPGPPPGPPAIGYLARLCRDKGLETLVDAFIALRRRGAAGPVRLRAAGAMLRGDRKFVRRMEQRLEAAGVRRDVEFLPNIDRAAKVAFLQSLTLLSVPATYGESFGLYLLEAMACGVPVVQPRHGAFPEIIEATGGGVLCAADDPAALAGSLEELLLDQLHARRLGQAGRAAVQARFTAERMAAEMEALCMMVAPR